MNKINIAHIFFLFATLLIASHFFSTKPNNDGFVERTNRIIERQNNRR